MKTIHRRNLPCLYPCPWKSRDWGHSAWMTWAGLKLRGDECGKEPTPDWFKRGKSVRTSRKDGSIGLLINRIYRISIYEAICNSYETKKRKVETNLNLENHRKIKNEK